LARRHLHIGQHATIEWRDEAKPGVVHLEAADDA
jgi:hypothetical protein